MRIRPCQPTDLPRIQEIENASFPDPYSPTLFQSYQQRTPETFLVAEDEQVVGYLIYAVVHEHTYLVSIATDPRHRRKGIASRLLQEALTKLPPHVRWMELQVGVSNVAARNLYKKYQFQIAGRIPHYYRNGEDAFTMVRSF